MKAKSKTAKWLENLGKATIVYKDETGYCTMREALTLDEAKALTRNAGAELITYNGKLVK